MSLCSRDLPTGVVCSATATYVVTLSDGTYPTCLCTPCAAHWRTDARPTGNGCIIRSLAPVPPEVPAGP